MKIISLFVMFILLGVAGNAQEAKVVTEYVANADKAVKNSPFSAEAVSESVQTLADGNRIVRKSTSKLYRNSEGRFRRESTGASGGFYTFGHGVSLFDPIGGFRYMIDDHLKTTRQMVMNPKLEFKIVTSVGQSLEAAIAARKAREEIRAARGTAAVTDKIREEIKAAVTAGPAPAPAPRVVVGSVVGGEALMGVGMPYAIGSNHQKWETRTEQLGVQNIEGVEAEGTRTITTIPAEAIGNERPIEIVYEKWYSSELQLVVMSKHNDPRFGEQTYRLTNIVRSEPDPSLFTPPQGYKLITEPSGSYRVSTAPVKAAQAEKTARAAKATTISHTKP